MTATKTTAQLARIAMPLLLACAFAAQAQITPSQLPLLTKAGAAVAPNVMLTMDDSGSMQFQHMPENVFAADTYATSNPVQSRTVRWDRADNYMITVNFYGTVPGVIASANYRLRALRAADTNTIFYNPAIRYQPWLTSDGVTRLPNSPVAAAWKNPMVRTGAAGTVVDLTRISPNGTFTAGSFVIGAQYRIVTAGTTSFTAIGAANNTVGTTFVATGVGAGTGTAIATEGSLNGTYNAGFFTIGTTYQIVTAGTTSFTAIGAANNNVGTTFVATGVGSGTGTASSGNWCYANDTNADCAAATAAFLHDPGAYFKLTQTAGVYNTVTTATNYTAYTINAAAATTYTKYPDRLDCAGATCSRADERQNFANWFTYYRNRNLLARGSLMEAFGVESAPVAAGTFVIGSSYVIVTPGTTSFTSIGAASNTADTVFVATGAGAGTGTARAIAMRLGFGRINKGSASVDGANTRVIESSATYGGGGVRDFNFARKANLFKWLEDLPADGGTPLVEAMQAVGEYYSRTSTQGPWTDNPAVNTNVVANNKTCRRSYQIMMTDGYWTGAVTVGNEDNTNGTSIASVGGATYQYVAAFPYKDEWSNTLADTAMRYWKADLQPLTNNAVPAVAENTSFWQNMTNFTVGLGVRGTLDPLVDLPALTAGTKVWPQAVAGGTGANVDDLWHAALNTRGKYFSAKDPQGLSLAIRTALAGATGGSGSTAGVATASSVLLGGNRKYVPGFAAGTWEGDIQSFPLDTSGQTTAAVWNAAAKMPAWNARNVVTFDDTSAVWAGTSFDWASLSLTSRLAMGPVAALYTTQFIDFLKGDHSQEGTAKPFRSRINLAGEPFILGDIVNANPVLIKGNFNGSYIDPAFGGAGAYNTFLTAKRARPAVLFAGSNDGMLHAFQDSAGATPATDGREIFAYVPRAVYGNLSKLADKNYGTTSTLPHQYFVDGPLHEADAFVKAPSAGAASWRNYLLGSLGAGGRAVFALDVTDSSSMNASSVRWELSSADHADLGYVTSPIKVGVLPNGRWVAIFGNGSGSTGFSATSGNAVLFIVDIEDASSNDAAARAGAVKKLTLDSTGGNGLGGVTVVPNIATGRTQYIYVGDLKGKLWKLVYDATAPSGFSIHGGAALFTATDSLSTPQPITGTPAVYNHSSGGQLVVFGTGRLLTTADASDTSSQSIYSVWDKSPDTVTRPMTRANLAARTLTSFAGTGAAAGTTYYSSTGAAVDYTGTQRGWYMDLGTAITGGRVIYPVQVISYNTALISSVAPVQGTPVACESGSGIAVNIVTPVESGTNPPSRTFDTNGDGNIDGGDALGSIGYGTKADGVDAVVTTGSTSSGGTDTTTAGIGGGGSENECTGVNCKKGKKCVYSPICGVGKCLATIQNSTTGVKSCYDPGTDQRVWRRIINPPIR
ncbi:MAG: PilC/PilY family type IV pilus protein [Pseudomonadota bacterium]